LDPVARRWEARLAEWSGGGGGGGRSRGLPPPQLCHIALAAPLGERPFSVGFSHGVARRRTQPSGSALRCAHALVRPQSTAQQGALCNGGRLLRQPFRHTPHNGRPQATQRARPSHLKWSQSAAGLFFCRRRLSTGRRNLGSCYAQRQAVCLGGRQKNWDLEESQFSRLLWLT